MAKPMPIVPGLSEEIKAQIESEWQAYWQWYIQNYPYFDGEDYCDERQAFYRERLNELLYSW